jgi:2-phosphoglycerate kinase
VAELDRVRWLGGGSGAGKSSVARALAARDPALVVVDTDALMADHARRADPAAAPALARFAAATMDERWLGSTPAQMLDGFHWFRGEAFDLLLADVAALSAALPADRPVLVEGFRLLPALVAPLLAEPSHALWLLPTPAFRRRAFAERGSLDDVAGRTSDPPRALANLLERDALFTDRLRAQCSDLRLPVLDVDGSVPLQVLADRVGAALWTAGAPGAVVRAW